jgi:short-subunit dehydrogenase
MHFSGQVIWITGASSGIGEALARQCAQAGAWLILSARREAELERVRQSCPFPDKVRVLPLDLAESSQFAAAAAEAFGWQSRLDLLINNGGISHRTTALETSEALDRQIMEVNYFGQVALTKSVLPHMIRQGSGHVAVVASLTGYFGYRLRSAYAASKHALHGFFESLYLELREQGIRVSIINPGRVRTNIAYHALMADGKPQGRMDEFIAHGIDPEECARRILRGLARGRVMIDVGREDVAMVYIKRFWPALFRWIALRTPAS